MGDLLYYLAAVRRNTLPAVGNCNVLFNVVDNAGTTARIKKAKEISDLPTVNQVMLDSGGFSILTAEGSNKRIISDPARPLYISKTEMNISPLHVVQAASALQPDVMISLDYPIRKLKHEQERRAEFSKKLPYNVKFAIETCQLQQRYCRHIPLLLAVQAYSVDDFYKFEKSVRGLTFEGFSMPVRNLSLEEMAFFLFTCSRIAPKKFHLLGTSKFFDIALSAYFAAHYFGSVSFDSQSWRIVSEHWGYLNPLNLHVESIQSEDLGNTDYLRSYCSCPVCKRYSLKQIRDCPFSKRAAVLRHHNVFATQRVAQDLVHNATTLSIFERFLKGRTLKIKPIDDLIQILSTIDAHKCKDSLMEKQQPRLKIEITSSSNKA